MVLAELFWRLHDGLPRQAPGSDASTRRLLDLARPWPDAPRMLDIGCGPGRSSLVLAAETGGTVTAVDLRKPFLDELAAAATGRRRAARDRHPGSLGLRVRLRGLRAPLLGWRIALGR